MFGWSRLFEIASVAVVGDETDDDVGLFEWSDDGLN